MLHLCRLFLLWSFGFGGEKIGLRHVLLPSLQKKQNKTPYVQDWNSSGSAGTQRKMPSAKPTFWRRWGRYEVDETSVRKGWLVLISPRMILPRPLKKKVHRLPEKGPGKPQAQRIKGHMRVTGISPEANERTLGTRKILSTQNSNYSLTSLESRKFVPNTGKSQILKRDSTPFYLGIPHIHTHTHTHTDEEDRKNRRKKYL